MKNFLAKFPILLVRILTIVFVTLLSVIVIANTIAGNFSSTINRALGTKTTKIVKNENDDTDTAYFKSDYSTNTYDPVTLEPIYEQEGIDRLKKDAEDACLEIEGEGLVLLKNNGALPLNKGSRVSLFGQGSVNFNYSSTGSSATSSANYPLLKDAMEREDIGFEVNGTLWSYYNDDYFRLVNNNGSTRQNIRTRTAINEAPWSGVIAAASGSFSSYGDAAIVVISRDSGEGSDVAVVGTDGKNGNYLALSQNEIDMLKGLTTLKKNNTFSKIVVILNAAVTLQLDFLTDSEIDVDACMWVGNVGKTGIYAVAKALCGDIVPSGRLSDTYVYDNFSSPAMASWVLNESQRFGQRYSNISNEPDKNPGTFKVRGTQSYYGVYVEGIYVGYRYYETRYEDVVLGTSNVGTYDYTNVVAYPFGYGLSYAQFTYSNFEVEENSDSFDISVTVTNTDTQYDGKEVVQIYLQKPYDASAGVETASVELVGYAKTDVLSKNNGSETVTINVSKEQFASYDVNANGGKGGYVLGKGNYYLATGKDAHDALNNILTAKNSDGVNVNLSKMTAEGNKSFTYKWNNSVRDESTYALSKETGNAITNQLDFADINRYEGRGSNSVNYVSRSNWTGTWPTQKIALVLTEAMVKDLASLEFNDLPETTESRPQYGVDSGIALVTLRSTEEVEIEYDDDLWEMFLDQMTFEQQSLLLANAAFGTDGFDGPINKPETADNDGPTGVVGSKTGISFPSEGIWASSFNNELIKKVAELLAEDALYNGLHSMYATGINIHRTPYGGRAHEYFSEDPFLTGLAVCYEVEGMQSKGVIPTLKHFAFNDEEDHRTDAICIWLNEQEAREIMLKPFEMAMRPSMGNAHAIMTSFNRAGCIWTSASSALMINISRGEWDFDGYSITDMADTGITEEYMRYTDGILNGTDLFLKNGKEDSLADGRFSVPFALRMRESCHRVLYVITNYSAAMNGLSSSDKVVLVTPWWQVALYAGIGVTAGLTAVGAGAWIAYYVLNLLNNQKEKENESK